MTTKYVVDTSALINKAVTTLIKDKEIEGTILIPHAVISELEHQANKGLEIGFIGLEEVQELHKLKVKVEFVGDRPNEMQIRFAKSGEIDALIRELAFQNKATLITADKVQAESGKAFGLHVRHLPKHPPKEKIEIETFFDDTTMSVHFKEGCYAYGKKGRPGNWKLEQVSETKLSSTKIQEMAKEVVEKTRIDPESFLEISRRGSTVIQYKNYRVVVVKPPVSDGWEITVVKPLTKLHLDEYKLPEELVERIKKGSAGILIAGEPGSGKSTLAQALAEYLLKQGKIVKTVESPRDLQVPDEVVQYSKNFASSEEIHDILFLSRPDNLIFDEIRDTPDFKLYIDLRLAGSNCIGVLHSSKPIDAIQRFIGRADVGMIPNIVDTILFVQAGIIQKVYTLNFLVKVPNGMTESDLARPIVEVIDFYTGKLEYEIYSYGEEMVVMPVQEIKTKNAIYDLAKIQIEKVFRKFTDEVEIEVLGNDRVVVSVPNTVIAKVIGNKGKTITEIEESLGIRIEVRELEPEKNPVDFTVKDDGKFLRIYTEPGIDVDIFTEDKFLFSAISSKKGEIKVHKQSENGRELLRAMNEDKEIIVKA